MCARAAWRCWTSVVCASCWASTAGGYRAAERDSARDGPNAPATRWLPRWPPSRYIATGAVGDAALGCIWSHNVTLGEGLGAKVRAMWTHPSIAAVQTRAIAALQSAMRDEMAA